MEINQSTKMLYNFKKMVKTTCPVGKNEAKNCPLFVILLTKKNCMK